MYEVINVEQGTQEWLNMRQNCIGASDAPAIMGVSKFKSAEVLLLEKLGKIKSKVNSFVTEKGHYLEEVARSKFEDQTFRTWCPIVLRKGYLIASLDGINDKEIWECKYVGKDVFELGECPPQYYPQIQQQLYISEAHCCHLTLINEHQDIKTIKIFPNDEYIKNMLVILDGFYQRMMLGQTDYQEFDEGEIVELVKQYESVKGKEEALKEKIFEMCNGRRTRAGRAVITFTKQKPKTVIDYDKIIEDNNIDVKKYSSTKEGTIVRKITITKGHM